MLGQPNHPQQHYDKTSIYHSPQLLVNTSRHRRRPARHLMERNKSYALIGLAGGILCGFLLCLWTKPFLPCTANDCCLKAKLRAEIHHEIVLDQQKESHGTSIPTHRPHKKQVLIGVMTAAKFIENRALAVWRTWAQSINGDVIFFSREGSASSHDIPLVALPGVTDVYPPQKKSFMMAKYLHDYGIDKYKYFMRVDDDVYIHGERLDQFLNTLNHSQPLYIGQAGTGKKEEVAELSLNPDENFCMGGPGVLMSGETLRRLIPHIGYCLQHLLSTHEDIELGRCIRMFVGIPCTWNYEMQLLFYHSYTHATSTHVFPHDLSGHEMDRAITLHPVKIPPLMYQVHNEMAIKKKAKLELHKLSVQREIEELNSMLEPVPINKREIGMATKQGNVHDYLPWVFITDKSQLAHNMFNVKRNHEGSWKSLLKQALDFTVDHLNKNALSRGSLFDQPEIIYGYRRFHPLKGVQLRLHVKFRLSKIRGKAHKSFVTQHIHLEAPLSEPELLQVEVKNADVVHLILPLSGKLKEFHRFLSQFERVCHAEDSCKLILVLYKTSSFQDIMKLIARSPLKLKIRTLRVSGDFSRAVALHNGIMTLEDKDLVMFIDVDIHFDPKSLNRVRQNTRLEYQAYFPIVFNQYDSQLTCQADSCPVDQQTAEDGTFRYFGFGIASMYKADYIKCGGFDLNIQGWGKEDVDLYTKMLKTNISVFRAADPGIVHIYHPKVCDSSLTAEQKVMCLNSRAASLASQNKLAKLYFKSQNSTL